MEDYSLYNLVWERSDYNVTYYPDRENFYVISGHTPTQIIESNPNPGYIYRECNQISIDCGAHFNGGRLACICLETDEEFYVEDETVEKSEETSIENESGNESEKKSGESQGKVNLDKSAKKVRNIGPRKRRGKIV